MKIFFIVFALVSASFSAHAGVVFTDTVTSVYAEAPAFAMGVRGTSYVGQGTRGYYAVKCKSQGWSYPGAPTQAILLFGKSPEREGAQVAVNKNLSGENCISLAGRLGFSDVKNPMYVRILENGTFTISEL